MHLTTRPETWRPYFKSFSVLQVDNRTFSLGSFSMANSSASCPELLAIIFSSGSPFSMSNNVLWRLLLHFSQLMTVFHSFDWYSGNKHLKQSLVILIHSVLAAEGLSSKAMQLPSHGFWRHGLVIGVSEYGYSVWKKDLCLWSQCWSTVLSFPLRTRAPTSRMFGWFFRLACFYTSMAQLWKLG